MSRISAVASQMRARMACDMVTLGGEVEAAAMLAWSARPTR